MQNEEETNKKEAAEDEDEIEEELDKGGFKGKIMDILKSNDLLEKRPSKLEVDQFLKLLLIFNQ